MPVDQFTDTRLANKQQCQGGAAKTSSDGNGSRRLDMSLRSGRRSQQQPCHRRPRNGELSIIGPRQSFTQGNLWLRVLLRRSIPVAGGTDRVSSKTRKDRNALGPESRIPGRVGKLSIPYLGNSGRDGKFRRMENSGDECNRAEADSSAESSSDKILLLLNNNPLMSLMSRIPYKLKMEGV